VIEETKRRNVVLLQYTDNKSLNWAISNTSLTHTLVPIKYTHLILMPYLLFTIISRFVSNQKVAGIVFRYMNDYESFTLSLIKFINEYLVISLSRVFNYKVAWICHNIDKESKSHHPGLSQILRILLVKYSKKIFVTDDIFKNEFAIRNKGVLSQNDIEDKLTSVSFGYSQGINESVLSMKYDNSKENILIWNKMIDQFANENSINSKVDLVGLWIGVNSDKINGSIDEIVELIENISKSVSAYAIIAGPVGGYIKMNPTLYQKIVSNHRILFINDIIPLELILEKKIVNFSYKAYKDTSLSYTIYFTAYNHIPFVTKNASILSDIVENHNIGFGCNVSAVNAHTFQREILNNENYSYDVFTSNHTWSIGAKSLISCFE
jgi:hypothetical protein